MHEWLRVTDELNTVKVTIATKPLNLKKISIEYVTTGLILSKTITRYQFTNVEQNLHIASFEELYVGEHAGSPTNNPDVTKCATNWFKLYKELRVEDTTSIETSRYQL
ncbi:16436_t:CDS:2 [Entrophospora sp. SA101]|nr:14760_t:CDS:2 [Entrophospora sp. SA101]CAJ0639392.1 16436_t:CDS:2 [Entrophospora sp. SA101]CAJ0871768.1 2621_t:CDS:2 [Entrophospora sp. SA101]CAJ0904472.1 3426_t:CDS:2 [Entrophospora sp. SA101]